MEIVAFVSVAFSRVKVYAPTLVEVLRVVPSDTVATSFPNEPPVTLNSGANSPAQIHCASAGHRESLIVTRVTLSPSA